ncbi:hypothetical protein L208DRAFT_1237199, partial [Tricholoma matsutake]
DDDDSDDELAVHEAGIENDSAAVPDDGRDAHDTAIVKTTRGQAIEMMRKRGISIDPLEEKMALQLFPRVAGLARRVHDSSTLKEKFDILVTNDKDLSGNKETLDHWVPTRWNSDLTCLDAHLYFRSPVEQLTGAAINKLQAYWLSEDQWDLAETLSAVLEVFDGPTKLFSQSQVPLIADVIPMLDSIEQSMTLVHDDKESELPNVVCVAAQATLLLINKWSPM